MGSTQSTARLVLRVVVHGMATALGANGINGMFLTPAYDSKSISAEDQNHLRVFWAVPTIMSFGIHYGLYNFYRDNRNVLERQKTGRLLREIASWMGTAAAVRLFSIVTLGDPKPRMAPIAVECAFVPLLWILSSNP
ncbi:expressed unknown protein [Seminavis robusta]|uniref:Uncharacterized protein n=1 Tax=Seminavis robusta TaxID=568900 RepID=A0A9N8E7U7_9STRA|nr:expressed unknown protein [Seminavis robusta]|eukprot:Sro642_g180180.1 n/a (137) ;mRNA; f:33421-33831